MEQKLSLPGRLCRSALACAFAFFWAALIAVAAEPATKTYNIPAGNAEDALRQFSEQSGEQVVYPTASIRGVRTQPVQGSLPALDALQRLVAGTDLVVQRDASTGALSVTRPGAGAASAATGTISGRIFNPATGEYIRYAELRLDPSGTTLSSGTEGDYEFTGLTPGRYSITVSYTGYRTQTAVVEVPPGGTANRNFDLVSTLQAAGGDGAITLEAFVVSSEREGNAKAIMEQRNSMNITNSVASDVFGDNAEGNVGEFLKHLPGVELDTAYGEVRNVRLGGMGSEYTSVTMDGVTLASADANAGTNGNARAFSFEQVSLSSMDSIEISKTISADVDANAPAGTINLKTKRAFERAGRRISILANLAGHSSDFTWRKTAGPDDKGRTHKFGPGGIFEYSDVFLNKRLGIVFNLSESNQYQEYWRTQLSYSRNTTALDPRPEVITALNFHHAPRFNKRFSTTLTTDFRASSRLVLGLGVIYNYAELWNPQRTVIFNIGTASTSRPGAIGDDPLYKFTSTSTAGYVQSNPVAVSKMGETFSLVPKFEYKLGRVVVNGTFSMSRSTSWYDPYGRQHAIRDANNPTNRGVTFTAERSRDPLAVDWRVTQTGGKDIADGNSYRGGSSDTEISPAMTIWDGRKSKTELYSGEVTGTITTKLVIPVVFKTGVKSKYEIRHFVNEQTAMRYNLIDPATGGGLGLGGFRSAYDFDTAMSGGSITALNGGSVFMPDLNAINGYQRLVPEAFRQNINASSYYSAYIDQKKHYEEQIDAAYAMATAQIQKAYFRAGLRWEQTSTDSQEFDPHSPDEVRAAGFAESAGRATTIPGLIYQYFDKPYVHRTGSYYNWFPSASFKYTLTRNLNLNFGYSSTIRRPTFSNVTGVWSINDDTLRVSAPNPDLNPERSQNFSSRLAYYFEPVGMLGISVGQKNVKNLIASDEMTAEEFGYKGELDLSNYTFVTYGNRPGETKIRTLEFEYSQSLSFLPKPFKGLHVRASYTRAYANIPTTNMAPHSASAGINYSYKNLSVGFNGTWSDDIPTSTTGLSWRRHLYNLDGNVNYKLNSQFSLFLSGRNLTNEPIINMQMVPPNLPVMTQSQIPGSSWTFGIKGVF